MRRDLKDIDVFIVFASRPTHKVEVSGMAVLADIPVDGRVRLYEILAKAKIPPHANLHGSYVLRDGQFIKVDIVRLIKQGDMSQNIVMMPQDKVYIASPDDASVLVMGEVKRIGLIPLLNGSMSLREALVLSGGIPYSGDKDNINVIRSNNQCTKVFVLSWCDLIHYPADQQLLIPGDVVYVSAKPITEWNRFMEDLMPTLVNLANADIIARFMR
ncbi:MAG: sugar transporter, partial [Parachlamydiaceae bacterium]